MPLLKRQVISSKYPVPLVAKDVGFYHRLKKAKNPSSLRLISRNKDPRCLEIFITATTIKWRCQKDADTQLHCYECPQRQQRECSLWALARCHYFWSSYLRMKNNVGGFLEHPLVRASRECLVLMWLRLQRVYRISRKDISLEAEVHMGKRRKKK